VFKLRKKGAGFMKKRNAILYIVCLLVFAGFILNETKADAATAGIKIENGEDSYDVTGDGKADKIEIKCTYPDQYGNDCGGGWKIIVNNKTVWTQKEKDPYYCIRVTLYRVSKKQIYFEILVYGWEDSNEHLHTLYQMKAEKLKSICDFRKPILKYMNDGRYSIGIKSMTSKKMVVEGYNQFYATGVINWKMTYKLKGGKWQRQGSSYAVYRWDNLEKWTAGRKITAYTTAGGSKKAFTVNPGDKVKIKKIQLKKNNTYIQLVNSKGKKGWMKNPKTYDWGEEYYFKENMFVG